MQQEEVEDVYPSEENVNCDAFGRLFKNPSLMPHFVVTMDHFSTGHQERKNSYHSPAVDLSGYLNIEALHCEGWRLFDSLNSVVTALEFKAKGSGGNPSNYQLFSFPLFAL